jgi:hypothetical protein
MIFSKSLSFRNAPRAALAALVLAQAPFGAPAYAAHKKPAHHAAAKAAPAPAPAHHTPPPFIAMDVASGRVIEARVRGGSRSIRRWSFPRAPRA